MQSKTELFGSEFQEQSELSLFEALHDHGINTNLARSEQELHMMQSFINGELKKDEYDYCIKKFGRNIVCSMLFYGTKSAMLEYEKHLKSIEEDADHMKSGMESPLQLSQ